MCLKRDQVEGGENDVLRRLNHIQSGMSTIPDGFRLEFSVTEKMEEQHIAASLSNRMIFRGT